LGVLGFVFGLCCGSLIDYLLQSLVYAYYSSYSLREVRHLSDSLSNDRANVYLVSVDALGRMNPAMVNFSSKSLKSWRKYGKL